MVMRVKHCIWLSCIFCLLIVIGFSQKGMASCTLGLSINGVISASTLDYLERAQSRAKELGCEAIYLRVNTPGGSLQSTRLIIENILASSVPYLCLITPSGGHAGSAGAIILQACHVNGGLPTTNLGAATPVLLGSGDKTSEDLRNKMVNDTVSLLEGITKLRNRNLKFSREIVTEGKALSSEEAHKIGALDILAKNETDFLEQSAHRKVQMKDQEIHSVAIHTLTEFPQDMRYKVLDFIADPEFAYLLFMGSLALLYLEISNPGLIVPGVLGGIGFVLSLIAFHKLNVAWGGLALILLGIIFLIAELFVPSFGALGIGGLVSLFVGSLFLFDANVSGYTLPLSLILTVVGVLGLFFLGIGALALRTLRFKSRDADEDLKSTPGKVHSVDLGGRSGQVMILGEIWRFNSDVELQIHDSIRVIERHGLILKVRKE